MVCVMIRVGIADVTPLMDTEKYEEYYAQAPQWRKDKADKLKFAEDRALSIGAWILLEQMRSEFQIKGETVYNLSHSGKYAMCAIAEVADEKLQLGCDIERIGKWRPELVKRFFCESEQEYIAKYQTEEEKKDIFYRYWVWKESFMKATRLGMRLGLDTFEILPDGADRPSLGMRPEQFGDEYYFCEYGLREIPYKMAVCANCENISSELLEIHF